VEHSWRYFCRKLEARSGTDGPVFG
jgi:hypothetical protein